MAFHPMILSGLARMETDPGDARHLNYMLEHGFQWLRSNPGHADFWSPPFFFPEKNTSAYSETLLGVLPFYVPWRIAGFLPDTSLQLWTLTVSLLNFGAVYLLLTRLLGQGSLGSCLGAFLFSFGSPRIAQSGHQQLLAHFFTISAIASLAALFGPEGERTARWKRTAWVALFAASLVAQFYACFYLAWMLMFALSIACVATLFIRKARRRAVALISRCWPAISVCAVISALAIAPMVRHYSQALAVVGYRSFDAAAKMLPDPQAWLDLGPRNWLYGRFWARSQFGEMPFEGEKRLGVGLVTMLTVGYGLFVERNRTGVRVLLVTSAAVIVLTTMFANGFTLWSVVFGLVPGAGAIRAVARIGLVMLLPASIGLAFAFEHLSRLLSRAVLLPLAAFVIVEQGQTVPSYDKKGVRAEVEQVVRRVPEGCEAFFLVVPENQKMAWQTHLDAMWAGIAKGVPTVNGYSSNFPPRWDLLDDQIHGPGDEIRIRESLRRWLISHGHDPARTCLVSTR
jgi:hypothetical protein